MDIEHIAERLEAARVKGSATVQVSRYALTELLSENERLNAIIGLQAMTAKIEAKEKRDRKAYQRNLRTAASFGMGEQKAKTA